MPEPAVNHPVTALKDSRPGRGHRRASTERRGQWAPLVTRWLEQGPDEAGEGVCQIPEGLRAAPGLGLVLQTRTQRRKQPGKSLYMLNSKFLVSEICFLWMAQKMILYLKEWWELHFKITSAPQTAKNRALGLYLILPEHTL